MKGISMCQKRHGRLAGILFMALFLGITPFAAAEALPEAGTGEPGALSPEQKIERAQVLSEAAAAKAILALETGDLALAEEAQALANEASALLAEVAAFALETGNAELAQLALNAALGVGETLNVIAAAAQTIVATSSDPAAVAGAETLLATVEASQATNTGTLETAALAGGSMVAAMEAYEPPAPPAGPPAPPPSLVPPVVEAEPPITDLEPASPV